MTFSFCKTVRKYNIPIFLTILLAVISADKALAHGVVSSIKEENSLPVSIFRYADGTALSYGEVKVWAPDDDRIEFQNGRTDKNGKFSFVPDQEGTWRVEVNDGIGHAATTEYIVQSVIETGAAEPKAENPSALLAILGVSLLINLAFLIRNWKK